MAQNQEPTNREILEVINESNIRTEKRFEKLETKFEKLETNTNDILEAINGFATKAEERFEKIDKRFEKIEGDIGYLMSNMVTKDYLDDKIFDLRGDIIKVLDDNEVKQILTQGPFPKFVTP